MQGDSNFRVCLLKKYGHSNEEYFLVVMHVYFALQGESNVGINPEVLPFK